MSLLTAEIVVDAPRDRVWVVVSDPRNLPRWDHHVAEVRDVPEGALRAGSEYTTELRFMGARASVRARVLELRAPEYAKVLIEGVAEATVETWLEALEEDRTRLRHRVAYRFPGGPLGDLAARAVRTLGASTLLRRGLEAQKRQAEGR